MALIRKLERSGFNMKPTSSNLGLSVLIKRVAFLSLLLGMAISAFSEEKRDQNVRLTGSAAITSKGLSTFPNLTLGKPALLFDMSLGNENFRFDPTLRFGIDGKPWTFIFWVRYEAIQSEKFGLRLGAHPAYSFKTISTNQNGQVSEVLRTHQYLAAEIVPVFKVSKNLSIAPFVVFAYGVDSDAVKFSNFISLLANIANLPITDEIYSNLMAQVYYLKMDANRGYYFNSTLSLNKRNFPLSLSATINKAIDTSLLGEKFLWNINLIYRFGGIFRPV